jgi:hypothetical protein
MAGIDNDLKQIRQALYGKDVREALAHGLQQCYSDVSNGKTIAETASENAETDVSEAIGRLNTAIQNAETATQQANTARDEANTARDRALVVANGFEIATVEFIAQELGIPLEEETEDA